MNKETIYNQYAIEQGYEDFNHFILDDMFEGNLDNIMKTINTVTDFIQEELKKKITEEFGNEERQQVILNTEIL